MAEFMAAGIGLAGEAIGMVGTGIGPVAAGVTGTAATGVTDIGTAVAGAWAPLRLAQRQSVPQQPMAVLATNGRASGTAINTSRRR